jgi:hypothetical protein
MADRSESRLQKSSTMAACCWQSRCEANNISLPLRVKLASWGEHFLKRLPGVGSDPGSSRFHLFSHFHHSGSPLSEGILSISFSRRGEHSLLLRRKGPNRHI